MSSALPVDELRTHFPALDRTHNGQPVAYFDGPAGSQVPQSVIDAVADYLANRNANCGAPFDTSRETDATLQAGREAAADLVGTDDPDTIAFGPNMTTMTLALSRALAATWGPEDEIIVSRLDHDANVTPWVLAARTARARVRYIDVVADDCTLDLGSFRDALSNRTRLVAVGYASNAAGTINPLEEIVAESHSAGAMTFVDAVHYAPHGLIDVAGLGCDFLACSGYKFFGPHVGMLWGRRELLETVQPFKLRPSPDALPGRWMTGTQNHEGIAGLTAAIDYLAAIGRSAAGPDAGRRKCLAAAYRAIGDYERELGQRLVEGLQQIPGVTIWGITDPERFTQRVPTVSFTHERHTPRAIAEHLADQGLCVWSGNHYALPLTETLGLEPEGTLRVGLLHYNTAEEVDRLLQVLAAFLD
ncbi:putative cysteine desulfurase [Maioricimonas rarisocia]|uniref:Putative cysteine desulfurase n=1 Tax=Maioricimonas rarisocia TaxID=2528026 RepID=A0A517Z021_9PLAN|nr:cysteine desulfurase-like protein [Maioricimonas rarisocia]QDU35841.1 putative cysteine desulfurase [Maioricimonas rarisocia]